MQHIETFGNVFNKCHFTSQRVQFVFNIFIIFTLINVRLKASAIFIQQIAISLGIADYKNALFTRWHHDQQGSYSDYLISHVQVSK